MKSTKTKTQQTTLEKLKAKADSSYSDGCRMPSIKAIAEMLDEYGIEYSLSGSVNIVEYSSKGKPICKQPASRKGRQRT
jgi:hypothetical protein